MQELKQHKITENRDILEGMKGKFEVVDYYPNETKQDQVSGFGAICVKDPQGNTYFAMRGTDLKNWSHLTNLQDLLADGGLVFNSMPEEQVRDMVAFIERNTTNEKQMRILGHSLGGALAQIATAMYPKQTGEAYTFNSP